MTKNKQFQCLPQTTIAGTFLLVIALLMMIMQIYSDSIPDYAGECGTLIDLGFKILPRIEGFDWLADTWVLVSILIFVVYAIYTSELALRRFFWLLAIVFLFRAIVIPVTRYPGLPIDTNRYRPDNWFIGSLLILAGRHKTATDMMFSGHTANWTLTALLMGRYSKYKWFSVLFSIFNLGGVLTLIMLEEHYMSDVLVGFIISTLTFLVYHLFFDKLFMRFWAPGYTIITNGEIITVNGKGKRTWIPGVTSTGYFKLFKWLRWLDGE